MQRGRGCVEGNQAAGSHAIQAWNFLEGSGKLLSGPEPDG